MEIFVALPLNYRETISEQFTTNHVTPKGQMLTLHTYAKQDLPTGHTYVPKIEL